MKIIFKILFQNFGLLLCLFNFNLIKADELYSDKYVVKIELYFHQSDYWNQLIINKDSETDIPASMIVNDSISFDSVGVRFKGNSSYNIPNEKKSFNISIDAYKDNYRLFGYKTLNLNNCFVDPTFVREKISNEIFSKYMPAPATGFVRLYINGTYWGLYSNVEQINKIFLSKWFPSNNGNLYKGDPKGSFIWKGNNPDLYKMDYEKKTNEKDDNWNDLVLFVNIINNSKNLSEELKLVLDIDRTAWYFALCNILVNLDSYIFSGHNYYIYNDPSTQQFKFLNWDMNESFGVFPPQLNNRERFEIINDKNPNLPLLKAFFSVPEFKEIYLAHYKTIFKKSYILDSVISRANELQNLIDTFVKEDNKKLYSYNDFKKNLNDDVFVQGRLVPGLASFIKKRRAFLDGLYDLTKESPKILYLKISNNRPYPLDTIFFNLKCENHSIIKNIFLLYKIGNSLYNKIKMFDDGLHEDSSANDGIYGTSIVIPNDSYGEKIYYHSIAEDFNGTLKFEPEEAEFKVYQAVIQNSGNINKLVINEFMADNKTIIQNEESNYSDWIELFNPNDFDVKLKGMYLTDDSMKTTKWAFPDTVISSNGYMLVWADESKSKIGLHTNFKLNKEGEFIGLYYNIQSVNVLIDSYNYKEQSADISEGRYPNGVGSFLYMNIPTPNKENIYKPNNIYSINDEELIRIFPNPAQDYIIIKNGQHFDIYSNLNITNIYGYQIKDISVSQIDDNTMIIDLKSLASGIYFLTINFNYTNKHYKIRILK